MYRLFKSNQPFVAYFIPLISLALVGLSILYKGPETYIDLSFITSADSKLFSWYILVITSASISATALMLNRLFIKASFISVKNFIPAFVYTILASLCFHWTGLIGPFIANVFFVLSLLHFYSTYDRIGVLDSHFRTGFWLGLAALLVPSFLIYLLIFFFLTLKNRAFLFTEFISIVLGLLVPFFYLFIYTYYFLDSIQFPFIFSLHWVTISDHIMAESFSYFLLHFLILLLIFSGGYYFLNSYASNIKKMLVSKNSLFPFLWVTLLFTMFSISVPINYGFITMAIPLTILISFNFLENIHNKLKPVLFNLFLILSLGIFALNIVYKY